MLSTDSGLGFGLDLHQARRVPSGLVPERPGVGRRHVPGLTGQRSRVRRATRNSDPRHCVLLHDRGAHQSSTHNIDVGFTAPSISHQHPAGTLNVPVVNPGIVVIAGALPPPARALTFTPVTVPPEIVTVASR